MGFNPMTPRPNKSQVRLILHSEMLVSKYHAHALVYEFVDNPGYMLDKMYNYDVSFVVKLLPWLQNI